MRETVHVLGAFLILSGCYGIVWLGLQGYYAVQAEVRHHCVSARADGVGQDFTAQAFPVPPVIPDSRLAHQKLPFVMKP